MADEQPDWLIKFQAELDRRIEIFHQLWQFSRSRASPKPSAERALQAKLTVLLWAKQQAEWSEEHDLAFVLRALARDECEIKILRQHETAAGVAAADQNSAAAEFYQDQAGWILMLFDQVEAVINQGKQEDKTWGEMMPWDKAMYRAMVQTVAAELIKEI